MAKRAEQPIDPYATLGVPRGSDDGEIKKAYFRLVREFPPEREPEKFQQIRAAYERVKTAEARRETDLFLLQPPGSLPKRRQPTFDLTVQPQDILTLALELRLADLSLQDDFNEPRLPE